MEGFLIALRDVMEYRNGAERVLLCIKQGEGTQGDVDGVSGRQLEHPGFVVETARRILIHQQAHEPGLECAGWLGLVASLVAPKELLVVSPSTKSFRGHFKELEGGCIGLEDLALTITDHDAIRESI